MIPEKSKLSTLSKVFAGLIILLSLTAFSGSVLTGTDTRKPTDREVVARRTSLNIKDVSLQHALQQAIIADFLHQSSLASLSNSHQQLERVMQISLHAHEEEKPDLQKISYALMLHAPRSTDDLLNIS